MSQAKCPFGYGSSTSAEKVADIAVSGSSANENTSTSKCPFLNGNNISQSTPHHPGKPKVRELFDGGNLEKLQMYVLEATSLKPKDIAIVKEGWNKALAFRDRLFFECLSERWFYICPTVAKSLRAEVEDINSFLYGWIDLAVHSIQVETEHIHRETFQPIHASAPSTQRFHTVERYAAQLVILGIDANAVLGLEEAFYFTLKTHCPYFEDSDREYLKDRENAPLVRFFRQHILGSYSVAYAKISSLPSEIQPLAVIWVASTGNDPLKFGRRFYQLLFTENPDLIDYFADTEMDHIAKHLMDALTLVFTSCHNWEAVIPVLESLGGVHRRCMIPTWAYALILKGFVELFTETLAENFTSTYLFSLAYLYDLISSVIAFPHFLVEQQASEANDFFNQAASHFGWSAEAVNQRKLRALREIYATGTHELTSEELTFGAQLAWRNSAKCCGRIAWNTLLVRDCRTTEDPKAIFESCVEHQRLATAGTNLQSVMTIFRPRKPLERWGPRIWNSQFIRFACWELEDGTILGDVANLDLTEHILEYFPEWEPKVKTAFDVLPLVIEIPGAAPIMYPVPEEVATLIHIEHPDVATIKDLGFKWCAVPTITNFNLRLAGVDFVCCPFNGWFMDLEVSRNFLDRYNAAEVFVKHFPDLLARKDKGDSSWLDVIFIEITRAVYHSFQKEKYSMVDRATVSRQFAIHLSREREAGREVPAQWSWIGGLLGPVYEPWKHECRDFLLNPQYQYQADIFVVAPYIASTENSADQTAVTAFSSSQSGDSSIEIENALAILAKGVPKVTILYGSETGTAESYARKLASELSLLNPTIASLNEAADSVKSDISSNLLVSCDVLLILTSTFGNGQAPFNAAKFANLVEYPNLGISSISQKPVKIAVCALGSTVYPEFAAFGRKVWFELKAAGAIGLFDYVTADEIVGQTSVIYGWIESIKLSILPKSLANALRIVAPPSKITKIRSKKSINTTTTTPSSTATTSLKFLPVSKEQYKACPVVATRELRRVANAKNGSSTKRIEIDISQYGPNAYITGDHCAVLPVRPLSDVLLICDLLGVSPTDTLELVDCIEDHSSSSIHATPESIEAIIYEGAQKFIVQGISTTSVLLPYNGLTWLELFSIVVETSLLPSFIGPLVQLLADAADALLAGPVNTEFSVAQYERFKELIKIAQIFNRPAVPKFSISKTHAAAVSNPNVAASQESKEETTTSILPTSINAFIDHFISLAALLQYFPELAIKIDLVKLLSVLPKSKARYYSISSSHLKDPMKLALTVGLMYETTDQKTVRRGLCSGYLNDIQVGENVLVAIRASSFRLPQELSAPVICVGPGTGFAPFAAFLDHRHSLLLGASSTSSSSEQKGGPAPVIPSIGPFFVFTGAKVADDLIYGDEFDLWTSNYSSTTPLTSASTESKNDPSEANENVNYISNENVNQLSEIYVALSREGKKQRVQQLIQEKAAEIVDILINKKGYYYCCGDSRMSNDVIEMLIDIISKEKRISRIAAKDLLNAMRDTGRFQLDLWGLTTFFSQGITQFKDKRANNVRNWLEMMK